MFGYKKGSLKVQVCCFNQRPRLRSLWFSPDLCNLRATHFALSYQQNWMRFLYILIIHPESLASHRGIILLVFPLVGMWYNLSNLCLDVTNLKVRGLRHKMHEQLLSTNCDHISWGLLNLKLLCLWRNYLPMCTFTIWTLVPISLNGRISPMPFSKC